MDRDKEITEFYLSTYVSKFKELLDRLGDVAAEREAQKYSIRLTALNFFEKYSDQDKNEIWNHIYSAHVKRKSGVDIEKETIAKVISADQSWKKSSGHAFEEMVEDVTNKHLRGSKIEILLQKELSSAIKQGLIKNEQQDVKWLKQQLKTDVFDLFAKSEGYVFGCIQAKTSIRDRVTRDREPSMEAMNKFFWSIAFVLDGEFLKLPKFKDMVNGGKSYTKNGWHGMYVFSLPSKAKQGRIYSLDKHFEPFIYHAKTALSQWMEQRQWFNNDWSPNSD